MQWILYFFVIFGASFAAPTTLSLQSTFKNYPFPDTVPINGTSYRIHYSSNAYLNLYTNKSLEIYHPDAGAVLICDLKTGRILALAEISDKEVRSTPALCFGKNFPAASLIKVMTATAAIELNLDDSIPQKGSYHTLYRSQLKLNRHLHKITLDQALAYSSNPAFGILGMRIGSMTLRVYGTRFGFNRILYPGVAPSRIIIADSGFKLSQASCGYIKTTTISPLHALQIARAIGDDGVFSMVDFADHVEAVEGSVEDSNAFFDEVKPTRLIADSSLPRLQELLEATIDEGTAKKGFHSVLSQSELDSMSIGGKTGTLCGDSPKGLYDWFIGYAKMKSDPSNGIALAVMFVHTKHRTIKSNKFAAILVREWYGYKTSRENYEKE